MNSASNILLMLVPERLLGSALLLMIALAGLAIVVGFRKAGVGLLITAISIPFVAVLVEALMNAFFASLPGAMVMPISVALMLVIYLWIAWLVIKLVFGQRAIDNAKGALLADAVKALLRMTFSRFGLIAIVVVLIGTLYLSPPYS